MNITHYGHCCLLIEEQGIQILIDPGSYSSGYTELENIDCVLITHEHPDHLHVDSLRTLLVHNPSAKVITNESVYEVLHTEGIACGVLRDNESIEVKGVMIEGLGTQHALIHSSIPQSGNTGFFINHLLWYPGDAFTDPKKKVHILALPVAGPWMKISEAIDYAIMVAPKVCFPVHDGGLKSPSTPHSISTRVLKEYGIEFTVLTHGASHSFE